MTVSIPAFCPCCYSLVLFIRETQAGETVHLDKLCLNPNCGGELQLMKEEK